MYGLKIDMLELWPQGTCGAQYALHVMYNTYGVSIRTIKGLPCKGK